MNKKKPLITKELLICRKMTKQVSVEKLYFKYIYATPDPGASHRGKRNQNSIVPISGRQSKKKPYIYVRAHIGMYTYIDAYANTHTSYIHRHAPMQVSYKEINM